MSLSNATLSLRVRGTLHTSMPLPGWDDPDQSDDPDPMPNATSLKPNGGKHYEYN